MERCEKGTLTPIVDRCKVDDVSRDDGHVATNIYAEIREGGITRERHAADAGVVGGAADLGVVCVDDSGVDEHKGRSGVGNRLATKGGHWCIASNGKGVGAELPETLRGVYSRPSQGAVELGGVDGAKLVLARSGMLQIGREDGLGKRGDGVVEEGLLLRGLHGVELAEGEAHEAIALGILDERS